MVATIRARLNIADNQIGEIIGKKFAGNLTILAKLPCSMRTMP
jgi:hypothetical protein